MFKTILTKTFRVSRLFNSHGKSIKTAKQLDAALLQSGFKLSADLFEYISGLASEDALQLAKKILPAVKKLIGDHVKHNTYFIDFPNNIPDTEAFWSECILDALKDPEAAEKVTFQLENIGLIKLIDLPKYGRYLHTYDDMVAVHEAFVESASDRVTILHLGDTLEAESLKLYHTLAGSKVPLSETDRDLLQTLAHVHLNDPQPMAIPIRENKALINSIRLAKGQSLLVNTPTDILRLACALSEGDVTLSTNTKFKPFSRPIRRSLVTALHDIVTNKPNKLQDIVTYRERWKRLARYLHIKDYKKCTGAQTAIDVAYKKIKINTLSTEVEKEFSKGHTLKAAQLLSSNPGVLFRNLDRILREYSNKSSVLMQIIRDAAKDVSTRVLLSLREHLLNRNGNMPSKRVFANSKGTVWVEDDGRKALTDNVRKAVVNMLDNEMSTRLESVGQLVVDPKALSLAVPLSEKTKTEGFAILPRGSEAPVLSNILRFFIYWKQASQCTDYDLSTIALDENFQMAFQVSYTNLRAKSYAYHSGDIIGAPHGASEFIDIKLNQLPDNVKYIVPVVYIFSGEGFHEVEESFFGYMERTEKQFGKPYEPKTVQNKSDLRGTRRIALPMVFIREDNGWSAKWMHLFLKGHPNFNQVENNNNVTPQIVRATVEREYLHVDYLVNLLKTKADMYSEYDDKKAYKGPVTYIGVEAPEKPLPEGSTVYTLNNLHEIIS